MYAASALAGHTTSFRERECGGDTVPFRGSYYWFLYMYFTSAPLVIKSLVCMVQRWK
jgi:hypothetical protein